MYGSLQSPNFPDPYPRETRLQWNLSVPVGFRIRLYFSHFDLEPSYLCEYDYVKVEAEEDQVLALFCGQEDTDTEAVPDQRIIESPRNSLKVSFSSDFSNEESTLGSGLTTALWIKAGGSDFGPFCGDRPPAEIQTDSNTAAIFFQRQLRRNLGWRSRTRLQEVSVQYLKLRPTPC
ncbi:Mannan-binding lectin serine protease 1 [Larimichthys crocea]|uniref:Mannan-binding lectin serine protease 1 n=1 Tax=Larimichthys crocea TaxID=215358 RepID=A0A6G0IU07_LARCR|nr:Mannan-binding lectin serine protease 1 [Larimichthys crocea]